MIKVIAKKSLIQDNKTILKQGVCYVGQIDGGVFIFENELGRQHPWVMGAEETDVFRFFEFFEIVEG